MEMKRKAVIALHLEKKSPIQIVRSLKRLKINEKFVYRTIKRYSETGGTNDRPRSGRPKSVTTENMVKKVKKLIDQNPNCSANRMATVMGISRQSVQRILKEELGLNPCKHQNELTVNNQGKVGL